MTPYTTSQVAKLFDCSTETVRRWSVEFEKHLQPKAQTGGGLKRNFDDSDLTVFALIHEMKAAGRVFDEIHIALANGERGTPPITDFLAPVDRSRLQTALADIEIYKQALDKARSDIAGKDMVIEYLERQIAAKDAEIARLHREAGKREG